MLLSHGLLAQGSCWVHLRVYLPFPCATYTSLKLPWAVCTVHISMLLLAHTCLEHTHHKWEAGQPYTHAKAKSQDNLFRKRSRQRQRRYLSSLSPATHRSSRRSNLRLTQLRRLSDRSGVARASSTQTFPTRRCLSPKRHYIPNPLPDTYHNQAESCIQAIKALLLSRYRLSHLTDMGGHADQEDHCQAAAGIKARGPALLLERPCKLENSQQLAPDPEGAGQQGEGPSTI